MVMQDWFGNLSKYAVCVASLLTALLVAWLDVVTGKDIRLSAFYFLPIFCVSWFGDRRMAVVVAIFCAGLGIEVDILLNRSYAYTFIPYWNLLVRLAIYLATVYLVTELKRHKEGLEQQVALRTDELATINDDLNRRIHDHKQAREELVESESFNRAVLNSMLAHVAVLDRSGTITAVNDSWRHFAGGDRLNEDQPLPFVDAGTDYLEVCRKSRGAGSEQALQALQGIQGVLNGEIESFSLEYPCHSASQERWFMMTVAPLGSKSGGAVVSHINVTERKKAEEERDQFFSLSREMFCIAGFDGYFKQVNPAWETILGVPSAQLLSEPYLDRVHPDDRAATIAEASRAHGDSSSVNFENRYRCHDGTYKWIHWSSTTDLDSKLVYAVASDITESKQAQADLRDSEERFRAMADSAPVLIWMADTDKLCFYLNKTWLQFTGRQLEKEIGHGWADGIHPDDLTHSLTTYHSSFDARQEFEMEYRLLRHDGEYRWLLDHGTPRFSSTGEFLGYIGSCIDITERKQVEATLVESQNRLSGIVGSAMDAIITIDEKQRIQLFNPAAELMFGHSSSNLLGQPINLLIPHRFRSGHSAHVENFGKLGVTNRKMGALGAISGLRANGEEFPIEASISQITVGSEKLYTVILRDITERQQAEAALQQSRNELELRVEERTAELVRANGHLQIELAERQRTALALREAQQMLQLVINHIPQAIFWKDRDSIFLGCNDSLARDAGYDSPDQLIGKSDNNMSWAEHAALYQADDAAVMEQDTPKLNIEEPLVRADGGVAWLRTNKIPLHNSVGEVVGVLASYEDITVQKLAEQTLLQAREAADEANRAKSEFLSRMSHELRTPLNSILGFAQIMEMQTNNAKQTHRIESILRAGQHLLQLINEVLDLSRVEAGRISLSPEPIAIDNAIKMAVDLVQPLSRQRQITISGDWEDCAGLYVRADQQRLAQVLLNVLSNAIKYNRINGKVQIICDRRSPDRLKIGIRDNGLGIQSQHLPRLFKPFERLGAEGGEVEGTGLGLALSKGLLEAMDCTIEVESVPDEGSTFWLELPLADALPEIDFKSPADQAVQITNGLHTILYIEDNLANLQVIEDVLDGQSNIRLLSAMQGQIGLDLARQHRPSLILLDLHLPDLPGLEVLRFLRADPSTSKIPVMVISADATPTQINRLLEAGASTYLTKPLDIRHFLKCLQKVLEPEEE